MMRKGTKVCYRHGRGESRGVFVRMVGRRAQIKTRNGHITYRRPEALTKA